MAESLANTLRLIKSKEIYETFYETGEETVFRERVYKSEEFGGLTVRVNGTTFDCDIYPPLYKDSPELRQALLNQKSLEQFKPDWRELGGLRLSQLVVQKDSFLIEDYLGKIVPFVLTLTVEPDDWRQRSLTHITALNALFSHPLVCSVLPCSSSSNLVVEVYVKDELKHLLPEGCTVNYAKIALKGYLMESL